MSRNTDANRKAHKKKIDQKKRKTQESEEKRKARLKEIRASFIEKENQQQDSES
ncbi:hypothetical protein [Soonwooa sp.]|uniref:hypothetical protein n=1 Tax=Soonwooa sp. TaxID=1938592 RepID=UPI0028974616|nr:hypothetical protein [Soonwooa sp.]